MLLVEGGGGGLAKWPPCVQWIIIIIAQSPQSKYLRRDKWAGRANTV